MFWFLDIQLYNLVPLVLRYLDPNAPIEIYTLANPIMIVSFQMLITRSCQEMDAGQVDHVRRGGRDGGMAINVLPSLLAGRRRHERSGSLGLAIPFAGIFILLSIASMATGEMMASPRIYEYLGSIAPKGQEGLFMGYASLPIALATIVGGTIGGKMFEHYISDPPRPAGADNTVRMWLIIAGIGVLSIIGLGIHDRLVRKKPV